MSSSTASTMTSPSSSFEPAEEIIHTATSPIHSQPSDSPRNWARPGMDLSQFEIENDLNIIHQSTPGLDLLNSPISPTPRSPPTPPPRSPPLQSGYIQAPWATYQPQMSAPAPPIEDYSIPILPQQFTEDELAALYASAEYSEYSNKGMMMMDTGFDGMILGGGYEYAGKEAGAIWPASYETTMMEEPPLYSPNMYGMDYDMGLLPGMMGYGEVIPPTWQDYSWADEAAEGTRDGYQDAGYGAADQMMAGYAWSSEDSRLAEAQGQLGEACNVVG